MLHYEVLIVGGGPAGSTCAWALQQAGVDVLVVDKSVFPRDKTCAGWVTPQVIRSLKLDTTEYKQARTFQPISRFRLSLRGHASVTVNHKAPVSYGIRRCEFDDYLLQRTKAKQQLGEGVQSIEKTPRGWIINGDILIDMLVGAGGHFCPVARHVRTQSRPVQQLVTAREAEFQNDAGQSIAPETEATPHLIFQPDLSGYGWVIQKGDYLNIGLGCVDSRETTSELAKFRKDLRTTGILKDDVNAPFHGHAYHLYGGSASHCVDDGVLLVGDAAGLAYPQSGEGIRPAVESGLLAARTILECRGEYTSKRLDSYVRALETRFGHWSKPSQMSHFLSTSLNETLAAWCLSNRWFARNMVLQRWFLHANQPALEITHTPTYRKLDVQAL